MAAQGENKYIAIAISVLALFLAIAETMAKGAQTNTIAANIEAANLWSFRQAKEHPADDAGVVSDQMAIDVALARDPVTKEMLEKRIAAWKLDIDRYQSEPKAGGGEGIKVARRARHCGREEARPLRGEVSPLRARSALFQIAIVLASVYLLTHVSALIWVAGLLAASGIGFTVIGLFFPHAVHLF